jgi:hypothetical protein
MMVDSFESWDFEKLVAECGESSGTQWKRNVRFRSRYQATSSEDSEHIKCAVITLIFEVCNLVRLS